MASIAETLPHDGGMAGKDANTFGDGTHTLSATGEGGIVELTSVLGFAAIAFTLIVVPGPDWAYVLAAGARTPAVAGLMTGYALITALVAAGAGPLLASVPAAMTVLTVTGAAYLTCLGVRMLRATTGHEPVPPVPDGRWFTRGVGVSALNPKGILIFLAILPQFTRTPHGWPLPIQLSVLGAVFILIVGVFYRSLGWAVTCLPRPHITTRIAATAMILTGPLLLAGHAFG
jgi:threonine/homoserine/homoserine lactone efflux protein